jgi:hypothetical protein
MEASPTPLHDPLSGVVVVLLADFLRQHQGWGWLRLVAGATPYKDVPGLTMVKVMGSGHGGGFSLRPSATHQGLICTSATSIWPSSFWTVLLCRPTAAAPASAGRACCPCNRPGAIGTNKPGKPAARKRWACLRRKRRAGRAIQANGMPHSGPFAVLTRASIVPTKAMAFWRYAPAAQADLGQAPGCLLAMGLGEAPLVRQCTFSLWQDTAAMLQYAQQGAHQVASAAAYKHQFFLNRFLCACRCCRWPVSGRPQFRCARQGRSEHRSADAALAGSRLAGVPSLEVSHV